LYKPVYDADAEQWGTHLNANADTLDLALGTSGVGALFLPLVGGTLTGPLTLPANATAALQAVTLQQMNAAINSGGVTSWNTRTGAVSMTLTDVTGVGGAPLASPAFTGTVTLPGDPAAALQAATKQYVDAGSAAAEHNVGRNLLHNGLFNVQQRGAGAWTTPNVYTADRWLNNAVLDSISFGIAPVDDVGRSQIGDEAARYSFNNAFTGNAGATAFTNLLQRIEGVRRLAGKTVTVSFWASASAAMNFGVSIDQSFGSGGSPSPVALGNGQAVALAASSWQRHSVTFAVPSVAGKTLGTNGDDFTQLALWYSAGANSATRAGNIGVQSGTIVLWGVQLEIGSVATPLEKLDPRVDLANCQRFYALGSAGWFGYGGAANNIGGMTTFPVAMRGTPTVVITGPGYNNASGAAASSIANNTCLIAAIATATGVAGFTCGYTASADL
jgi:hypothetical protein